MEALRRQFEAGLAAGKVSAGELLRDRRLKDLLASVKTKPADQRRAFGRAVNDLKDFLTAARGEEAEPAAEPLASFDVTAPFGVNQGAPAAMLDPAHGSLHPIAKTQDELVGIFARMGFEAVESRQLDNEFYMFDSLNFPQNHPARDEFDTFFLEEKDADGRALVAPAHTSTMQNRVLKRLKGRLEKGLPIAVVVPGRAFRNEDVDSTHDHMFYQLEGIYVAEKVTVANLIATLKEALSAFFKQELELKIQPFYFPFTEPSFEFAISCPFCDRAGVCRVCSGGWIELLGCGMIHPNVLSHAGVDPTRYNGFAWGLGLTRLTMIGHGIEDIRHFATGKLEFLRQFKA